MPTAKSLLYTARYVSWILKHPLNRGRSLQALGRYVRWQVGSRLLRHPVVHPFANDLRMFVSTGFWGATGIIYFGLEEYADMAFCAHVLRPGDLFVDVGSCFGTYSLLAAGVGGARSIAFEPDPSTAFWLEQNIKLNQLEAQITVRQTAVGASQGQVSFTNGLKSVNHVVEPGIATDASVRVPLTTLDAELVDRNPSVVKIDVEGFEMQVVEGARDSLNKASVLAVIVEDVGLGKRYQKQSDLHRRLLGLGFRSYRYLPGERSLLDLEEQPNSVEGNTLYVRQINEVRQRLKDAKPFRVLGRSV